MENLRLVYEHLMREAFECKQNEYYFAIADAYDNAAFHLDETRTLILCALINLKNKGKNVDTYIKSITATQLTDAREQCTVEFLNSVLQDLSFKNIVY